ncbi:hypothetical protein M0805_000391 [Coniferiporia weirii]|nr:hypothetical protein M0805_000391 [Coniferiporia weirii]
MHFLELPAEVLVIAFRHLPFRDLIRCRVVCSLLRSLVDSSFVLQYNIDLGASCVRENHFHPYTQLEKLAELRRSNIAWANLHWSQSFAPDGLDFGGIYDFSRKHFSYIMDLNEEDSHIGVIACLPLSPEHGIAASEKVVVCDFRISDFSVDVERDLVLAVEKVDFVARKGNYTVICNVHPLGLESSGIHPNASQSVISERFVALDNQYKTTTRLCGNHVGVLLTSERRSPACFDMFYLWDWTSGACKASMTSVGTGEAWDSFCFIAPDAILIPDSHIGQLNVFFFDDSPGSLHHGATFLLPAIVNVPGISYIGVCSNPPPSVPTCRIDADASPFVADPDDAILILTIDYILMPYSVHNDNVSKQTHVVAIRRYFLVQSARKAVEHAEQMGTTAPNGRTGGGAFPPSVLGSSYAGPGRGAHEVRRNKRTPCLNSEQWVRNTRWGLATPSADYQRHVYGTRFVAMGRREPGSGRGISFVVYDFNLRNARKGVSFEEDNEEDEEGTPTWPVEASRIVTTSTTVNIPGIFKNPFITTLPYRITRTESVFDWNSVMIDDERIIGIRDDDEDVPLYLEVLLM